MQCDECKLDKITHSPEVPLCEDCYINLFGSDDSDAYKLEHEVAKVTPSKQNYVYYMQVGDKTIPMRNWDSGDFLEIQELGGPIELRPLPSYTCVFQGQSERIIELKPNGTVLVHGQETSDPSVIGKAILEWAEIHVFKSDRG